MVLPARDPQEQKAMPDLDREERLIALASLGRESRLAKDEASRRRQSSSRRSPVPYCSSPVRKITPGQLSATVISG